MGEWIMGTITGNILFGYMDPQGGAEPELQIDLQAPGCYKPHSLIYEAKTIPI